MKIAVLSDIHANLVAFYRVAEHILAWKPDEVIMAGDLINRGPRPKECLQFYLEQQQNHRWRGVRGNHEDYVIKQSEAGIPPSSPEFEVHRASNWTYERLDREIAFLKSMPFQQSIYGPGGSEVRVVHASMQGNRIGIYPETPDDELEELIQRPTTTQPAVLCVGHTHRPLIRSLNGTLVINAGSAGLPFDGDNRLSYAQITWRRGHWEAKIIRLKYNMVKAEKDFFDTGYIPMAGPLVDLVLIELRDARSMLYNWFIQYQRLVSEGKISMQESVRQFLQNNTP